MFEPTSFRQDLRDYLRNRDVLVRIAALSAVLFTLSMGLCGVQFAFLVTSGSSQRLVGDAVTTAIVFAGYAELVGIMLGGLGLLFSGTALVIRTIYRHFHS